MTPATTLKTERRIGRPVAPETQVQVIESSAFAINRQAARTDRAYTEYCEHDGPHDAAADACEAAILRGDARAALRAIRALKAHDAAKDASLLPIPVATVAIRAEVRVICTTTSAIEAEMSAAVVVESARRLPEHGRRARGKSRGKR